MFNKHDRQDLKEAFILSLVIAINVIVGAVAVGLGLEIVLYCVKLFGGLECLINIIGDILKTSLLKP